VTCKGTFNKTILQKGIDYFHIPALTTAWVCSEVPEAMFVSAQAASNCNAALQNKWN
jgi:hypothetical protein